MKIRTTMGLGKMLFTVAMVLSLVSGAASAQGYPNKPLRLVVPFPPGGGADGLGRILAAKLSERLGRTVVVDNVAGANGTIGINNVAKSAPDGYTLGVVTATLTVSDAVGGNQYDIVKDLDPVVMLASSPMLITVNSAAPDANLLALIARAKASPGKLNYGTSGIGGIGHVTGELFKLRTGTDLVHVPYAGGGPLMLALLANQVDVIFADAPPALPQLKAGKIRVLAVASSTRSPTLPSIPTSVEAGGIRNFESMAWYAIMVAAGTPKDVTARLNAEFNAILAMPDVKEKLAAMALDPQGGAPEALANVIRREVGDWKGVVKNAGISRQ